MFNWVLNMPLLVEENNNEIFYEHAKIKEIKGIKN